LGPCENLKIPKSHQFEYQADYTNCSLQNADVWITAYTTSIKLDMYNMVTTSGGCLYFYYNMEGGPSAELKIYIQAGVNKTMTFRCMNHRLHYIYKIRHV
jgi:hypothetical protein